MPGGAVFLRRLLAWKSVQEFEEIFADLETILAKGIPLVHGDLIPLRLLFLRLPLLGSAFLLCRFRHLIAAKRGIADAEPIKNFQRSRNIGPSGALTEVRFGP